jgi:hypothetical protein
MNHRCAALGALALIAAPLLAREKTDVVVMENGDRLTGEIKGLSAGVLTISLDYVDGNLSLQWSRVARIESNQLFLLQTQDGTMRTGALSTAAAEAGRPVTIQLVEAADVHVPIERSQIVVMQETDERFLDRLSGDVNVGLVFTKGNDTTQYTLGSDVEYVQERWGAELSYNSNLSASTGANTSTRNQLMAKVWRRLPWNNFYYAGLAGFLQSSVQGINHQLTLGAGLGYFVKNTDRARISVLGGFAWENTNYRSTGIPLGEEKIYGALLSSRVRLYFFKRTNLDITAYVVPAISDPGRVFLRTNAAYYLKLFGRLTFDLSFYGNWDTQPPLHLPASDYGYSSGVRWTFGYR